MKFRNWLEAWGEEESPNQIQEIPIGQLLMTKEEIAAAVSNLSRGMPSMTSGPLKVNYHKSLRRYQLTNGYHRLVEALMNRQTSVQVQNDGPAEWRPPSKSEIFVPDWDEEYFGMEHFIEYYELRRLG